MKNIFILALLLLTKASFAQKDTVGLNIPIKDGYVVYEQVVDAPGRSKAALFSNAKTVLVSYFSGTKDVIQSEDKGNGQVIGRGSMVIIIKDFLGRADYFTDRFLVQIDCKDGRYRIRVSNQQLGNGHEFFTTEEFVGKLTGEWKSMDITKNEAKRGLQDTNGRILNMIADMARGMAAKSDDF